MVGMGKSIPGRSVLGMVRCVVGAGYGGGQGWWCVLSIGGA